MYRPELQVMKQMLIQAALLNDSISIASLLFLLLFLFLSLFYLLGFNDVAKSIKLPPSPPRLPLLGHLHCLGTLPHRSLQAQSHKYGPLMLLHLGWNPTLVVSSAEMAKEIMKTHDVVFSSRPNSTSIDTFLYGGKGVAFAPSGKYWTHMRKICVVDLLSAKRVKSFSYIRDEEIRDMICLIKQAESSRKDDPPTLNLTDLIILTLNNIVSRVAVGRRLEGKEGQSSESATLVKQVVDLIGSSSMEDLFPGFGWIDVLTGLDRRMKRTSKAWHQFLDKIIEEHLTSTKKDDDKKDITDLLLEYEKDDTLGFNFTREDLRALLLDIFAAGTDSTHNTLEWAMAELANHPSVMKKLQQEVRGVVGRAKSIVDEKDMNRMDYLNCVIKETLRLHAPIVLSLPRVSTASADVLGYHIPAKTKVLINLWAISRDPKIWDKPDEFIPERFINKSVDFLGNDFELVPFGGGRRGCPGLAFGIASMESVLANLVYWFDWELPNNKAIDMTEIAGISVHIKHPLHLVPISHSFS